MMASMYYPVSVCCPIQMRNVSLISVFALISALPLWMETSPAGLQAAQPEDITSVLRNSAFQMGRMGLHPDGVASRNRLCTDTVFYIICSIFPLIEVIPECYL